MLQVLTSCVALCWFGGQGGVPLGFPSCYLLFFLPEGAKT